MKEYNSKNTAGGRVAVFIDAANLEISAKERGWKVKSPSFTTGG